MKKITVLILFCLFLSAATGFSAEEIVITPDRAAEMALAENGDLAAAIHRMAAGEAGLNAAKADYLPSLSARYGYSYLQDDPIMKLPSGNQVVAHNQLSSWGLKVSQPLFTGFATSSQVEMSEAALSTVKNNVKNHELMVAYLAKSATHDLDLAKRMQRVAEEAVTSLKAQKKDSDSAFLQGLIARYELLKTDVALADAIQQQARSASDVSVARSRLNLLIGLPLLSATRVEVRGPMPAARLDADHVVSLALSSRPDIHMAEAGIRQAGAAVRLAKSNYYPSVALAGELTREGEDFFANENDYANDHNAAVGVSVSWNIFDFGRTSSSVAKARSEADAVSSQLKSIKDNARIEVIRALEAFSVAATNVKTSEATLASARESFRIQRLRFNQQLATTTNVLDARADLTQAEANYLVASHGVRTAMARLEQVTATRFDQLSLQATNDSDEIGR